MLILQAKFTIKYSGIYDILRYICYRLTDLFTRDILAKDMKLFAHLFGTIEKKNRRKTLVEYQEEMVGRLAKEQFEKLAKRGLQIPVVLL